LRAPESLHGVRNFIRMVVLQTNAGEHHFGWGCGCPDGILRVLNAISNEIFKNIDVTLIF
jgi:hypothetical protein